MSAPGTAPAEAGPRAPARMARIAAALAVLHAATVFFLSSLSNPLPELTMRVSDKILHGIEYASLAALVRVALGATRLGARRAFLAAVVAASLYGASDEFHQWFVPGRSCDVRDWLADTAGALAGAALAGAFLRRRGARASIRA